MCEHHNFNSFVRIARMEDTRQFMADITIQCADCNTSFQFLGMEPGIDTGGARVSIDGLEARIAICPQGSRPSPLQRMVFNVSSFDG